MSGVRLSLEAGEGNRRRIGDLVLASAGEQAASPPANRLPLPVVENGRAEMGVRRP